NYQASDGLNASNPATLTVTIQGSNDAPVANPDSKSTAEDTPLTFSASDLSANDTDLDGDSLTVTAVAATASTHGIVSLSGGNVTYTPDANYNGPASFGYTVSDGHGGNASSTVSVTVTAVNDAPVAQNGTLSTAEDTPATGTLAASDVDSPSLTYSIVG